MKKNLLWSVTLLIAGAVAITSCSKDPSGPGKKAPEDTHDAQFSVSLKLPVGIGPAVANANIAPLTRAEHIPTGVEGTIEDVWIYVFNSDGTLPQERSKGVFGPYDLATDFTETTAGSGEWKKNDPITATSGTGKKIYVVANPDKGDTQIKPADVHSEGYLLETVVKVTGGLLNFNGNSTPHSLVFIGKSEEDLLPVGTPANPVVNDVRVEIVRAISRVIVTGEAAIADQPWVGNSEATFIFDSYFVAQDAHSSYIAQGTFADGSVKTLISTKAEANWGDVLNLYSPSNYTTTSLPAYLSIEENPTGTGADQARADLPRFYIGENASNYPGQNAANEPAREGNTTYAWIRAQLTMTHTAVINSGVLEYSDQAPLNGSDATPANRTFNLIRVEGKYDHICLPANAAAVAAHLTAAGEVVKNYSFPEGNIYYRVFLNKTDENGNNLDLADKYNVYRNQFIHLNIKGVNLRPGAPGGFGVVYPGDPDNPQVPIDPIPVTPGDKEKNPNKPKVPTDPIDEEDATLNVTINVKEWEYMHNGVIL